MATEKFDIDAEREVKERSTCPACLARRLHTEEEWKNHPYRTHGYTKEQGYTYEKLKLHGKLPYLFCPACIENRKHTDEEWKNHPDVLVVEYKEVQILGSERVN